jgi:hypothetical protein
LTDSIEHPVLVVIGDATLRQLVGWILTELELPAQLVVP